MSRRADREIFPKTRKKKLTEQQIHQLNKLLPDYIRYMRLGGWNFKLMHNLLHDDNRHIACVTFHHNEPYVYLHLGRRFFEESREEQRLILVHELVHVVLNPIERVRHDMFTPNYKVVTEIENVWSRALEMATEALALQIAPNLPLPKKAIR